MYYALKSGSLDTTTSTNGHSNGSNAERQLMHAMSDFMQDVQVRFRIAKQEWSARLDDFTARLSVQQQQQQGSGSTSTDRLQQWPLYHTPFSVLLQLFAYKDVVSNGQLDSAFRMDCGASVTFFVPQLLSFLLHGAVQPDLEGWILQTCRTNVAFAHRCYWFLRAWCLTATKRVGESTPTPTDSRASSPRTNSTALPFLDEPATTEGSMSSFDCGGLVPSPLVDQRKGQLTAPLEAERQLIWQLLQRVQECGDHAAARASGAMVLGEESGPLVFMEAPEGNTTSHETSLESDTLFCLPQTPEAMHLAARKLWIPAHPRDSSPSPSHFATLSARHRIGFQPIEAAESSLDRQFDQTPQFLDALLQIADSLFALPREQRKEALRTRLRSLECLQLPSNAVQSPIGGGGCVWRIVADESIAISTKERVPCIIYLEVVDFKLPVEPQVRNSCGPDRLASANNSFDRDLSFDGLVESLVPQSFSPIVRINSLGNREHRVSISDEQQIKDWRSAPRNPFRTTSLLGKVSATVQSNVHIVQEHLNKLDRDRLANEEFQSLTGVDPGSHYSQELDIEHQSPLKTEAAGKKDDDFAPAQSQDASPSLGSKRADSTASIGQWSNPATPQGSEGSMSAFSFDKKKDPSRKLVSTPYGSGDHQRQDSDGLPPLSASNSHNALSSVPRNPPVVFRENWASKQERIRARSAYSKHPGWRLLPILIKANDDLRQEQLASQLIHRMAGILAREKVPVWLYPYEIIALTETGGMIEAIPDTISLDSLKKNVPGYTTLQNFFHAHFGSSTETLADAKASFVESLAAYSIVSFILQLKDRHNGNILLTNQGHLIQIDFGFFFLSSPGKNAGFESAPFKLTREFVELLDGPNSHLFRIFRDLCVKTFLALRRHCMEIVLLVEMLKQGNEELKCFRGRPDDAIAQLRERFRLDLNDRACREYVNALIDSSIENWRTDWYDRYQRYFVGVL